MNQDNEQLNNNQDNNNESNDDYNEESNSEVAEGKNEESKSATYAIDWLDWLETNIDWNLISLSSIWIFLTLTFFGIMF